MEEQYTIRGINGTSTMSQAAYEDYQQSLARRRAAGRFTLEEAAMILTEETKERAAPILEKLMQAARDGSLPVYEPGKHAQHQPHTVREFYEEAYWEDLNAWLDVHEQRITWRFPMPDALRDNREINAAFREIVYNGTAINWQYWVHQMPMLTAAQASRLMSALDPDIFESLDNRPNKNDPSQVCAEVKKIQRLAETQDKQSASPAEWLDWAKSQGFSVHAGFTLAVGELPNPPCNIENMPKIQRVTTIRAFLMDCIEQKIPANIESIWQHMIKNAGKKEPPLFLFVGVSKSTATTIHGKQVTKKNMARTLRDLLKATKTD